MFVESSTVSVLTHILIKLFEKFEETFLLKEALCESMKINFLSKSAQGLPTCRTVVQQAAK